MREEKKPAAKAADSSRLDQNATQEGEGAKPDAGWAGRNLLRKLPASIKSQPTPPIWRISYASRPRPQ